MIVKLIPEHPASYVKVQLPSGVYVRVNKRGVVFDDELAPVFNSDSFIINGIEQPKTEKPVKTEPTKKKLFKKSKK